ncbi:hypothetical protein QLS31_01825 [Flavobacterium sp. XS2P24]|jgi:hypothetical protein|uniref:hypothetical protein n=1 Tax=Flavobacterium sp. XS2P24 TaxID=3041249 RepID=UPI0024A8E454|nr:hypothetical protein [Flavobacterium sp. XS2P24]MDI6048563.1 hypothetical protein [Flavobacterium sp. XS2P24]
MKTIIAIFAILFITTSCGIIGSLNSNTSIKPKESFVLGNNKHGSFKTHLKNEGVTILKVYQAPIDGGTHSPVLINPQESVTVKTEKNTALIIENTGGEYASVSLKVKGDLNLGMTYKN